MSAKMSTTSYCYALIYAGASGREWVRPIRYTNALESQPRVKYKVTEITNVTIYTTQADVKCV